mgnify:CR=1 FL=1
MYNSAISTDELYMFPNPSEVPNLFRPVGPGEFCMNAKMCVVYDERVIARFPFTFVTYQNWPIAESKEPRRSEVKLSSPPALIEERVNVRQQIRSICPGLAPWWSPISEYEDTIFGAETPGAEPGHARTDMVQNPSPEVRLLHTKK